MKDLMRRFWTDESGQGLTEYALIIALVSIGLIAVLLLFRNAIGAVFDNIIEQLGDAPAAPYESGAG
jgi:pilus assembly protein Flp/PilA